jgi:hypothetical protein
LLKATLQESLDKMSLWQATNDIEELSYKLANVRDMIELVAEDVDSPYSGALWAIHSMIDDLQNKVIVQADKIMELHRETLKPKKTKK